MLLTLKKKKKKQNTHGVATLSFSASCVESCRHCTILLEPLFLQQGFSSNSELHIRRRFKKYGKNVHRSDVGTARCTLPTVRGGRGGGAAAAWPS